MRDAGRGNTLRYNPAALHLPTALLGLRNVALRFIYELRSPNVSLIFPNAVLGFPIVDETRLCNLRSACGRLPPTPWGT